MLHEDVQDIALRLGGWANQLAARFAAPVWLVGSTLEKGASARDVDVRIVVADDAFESRYGITAAMYAREMWSTWSDPSRRVGLDMAKLNAGAVHAFKMNMDVQIMPALMARAFDGRPRLRLDTIAAEAEARAAAESGREP